MRIRHLLLALALAAAPVPAPALAQPEPPRPTLSRGADPNDWEAYFAHGERVFADYPAQAAAAFYWASRLDPTRAEPYFARWAAFFAGDMGVWYEYVEDNPRVLARPDVVANDSLMGRAILRNPFVHRGFEALLYLMLGRRLRWDGAAAAYMNYSRGNFREAEQGFGRIVRSNPVRNAYFRQWRALSLVGAGQLDSAAVELAQLLEVLRMTDQVALNDHYASKAWQEYALGMLQEARSRPAEARRAYERALEEDLAMYPARAALARLSLHERRNDEALEHMAQAVEIAPGDGVMHYEHGNALLLAGRMEEAVAAYQRAIQREPHFADPYLRLAVALDGSGRIDEALAAYRAFLERAPRRKTGEIRRANERLAALGGQGG